MPILQNSRLIQRLARLEHKLAPAPQWVGSSWIWIDGRLHSQTTSEVYDSAEERAKAYRGQEVLFVDHVIVDAKNGRPAGYSDKRFFEQGTREDVG